MISPSMVTLFGGFSGDQNVELKYMYTYLYPVPATNGDVSAPSVELRVVLSSPFYKVERWADGTTITHNFAYVYPFGTHKSRPAHAGADPRSMSEDRWPGAVAAQDAACGVQLWLPRQERRERDVFRRR